MGVSHLFRFHVIMARFYLEPDKLLRTDYMQVMPGKFGTQPTT